MYRIQIRKYSSNVIEQKVMKNGKEKWIVCLCPTLKKTEGDKLAEQVLKTLLNPTF